MLPQAFPNIFALANVGFRFAGVGIYPDKKINS